MKAEMPLDQSILSISALLVSINLWSTQIPAILSGTPSGIYANIVFAVRKELFIAPQFLKCVFGELNDLPPSFQEFHNFIWKLIEAQRTEIPKVVPKACLISLLLFIFFC